MALVFGLMLGMALAAMDVTILSTAVPTIIHNLGGFSIFTWVFSLYMLTSATSVPVYGKLADLYGRKKIYLIGIFLFLLGSLLAGFSQNMLSLILSRGVQGLGAGALLPMTSTIVGDLYSIEQRAKIQGYLSSVWGISAIIGPAIGGFIVDHFSWRWIFFINLPIGVLSALLIMMYFHEKPLATKRAHIDYAGAASLTVAITSFLLFVLQGSESGRWFSNTGWFLLGVLFVSSIVFVIIERRALEPIIPFEIFRNRLISVSNAASLLAGGLTVGISTFVPTFAQGVLGTTATAAGAMLATMSIGWPIASTISGKLIIKWGYRPTAMLGMALDIIAITLLLTNIGLATSPYLIATLMFLLGAGLGLSTTSFIVATQNAVDWAQRGAATASSMFMRSLGNTLWVSVLGAVLNMSFSGALRSVRLPRDLPPDEIVAHYLLDPMQRAGLTPETLLALRTALTFSVKQVFFWVLLTAVAGFLIVLLLPRGKAADLRVAGDGVHGAE